MNTALVEKALQKVPNRSILVNLVSRRVRQLNGGGGATGRVLVSDIVNLRAGVPDLVFRPGFCGCA